MTAGQVTFYQGESVIFNPSMHIADFMSDPMYGYRDDTLREVPLEVYLQDFTYLCDISNKVNYNDELYVSSRKASKAASKYCANGLISSSMGVMASSIYKDETVRSHQFRELERRVSNSLEKSPYKNVPCNSPGCRNFAIPRSHTIQRQRILSTIVDASNSVYQTKQHPDNSVDLLHKVGWKEASTFPGFCEACEVEKFHEAESPNVTLTRKIAATLLWRAACFTRYRRAVEVRERARIVSEKRAYEIARQLEELNIPIASAMILKTRLSAFKVIDDWLQAFQRCGMGLHKRFRYFAIELADIPFVGAGAAPVYFDFNGKVLSSPRRFESNADVLCFSSFVADGKSFIVFGYDGARPHVCEFVKQMRSQSHEILAMFLPQIILANCDTVYFSPDWWDYKASELDKHIVFHSVFMDFSRMLFPWWGGIRGLKVVDIRDV